MTKIKVGCDIVEINRFNNLDTEVLKKIFHDSELKGNNPATTAGLFAAKESCKKVFNSLGWLDINIKHQKNGKPILFLDIKDSIKKSILSYDLSISHDKDYAIATAVFLIKE